MLNVLITSSSRYPIRRKKIKQMVAKTLEGLQLQGYFEVEINVIGDRKMKQLKKKHFGIDETTDVLSFPLQEKLYRGAQTKPQGFPTKEVAAPSPQLSTEFPSPDQVIRLGTIFVSYPQAQRQANLHKLTIDAEIDQLVEHGMLHLAGIHHE